MSDLTRTSKIARLSINFFVVGLALYSLLYFSFPGIVKTIKSLFPKKEKPIYIFGTLPQPKFYPLQINSDTKPVYELNTPNGRLPEDVTKEFFNVYKVQTPEQSFSAGKEAQEKAKKLGFSETELSSGLTSNIYKWIDTKRSRTLDINIVTGTLNYNTNIARLEGAFEIGPETSNIAVPSSIPNTLNIYNLFKDDLYKTRATTKTVFGKIVNGRVEETTTPQDYTVVKVDVFRTIFQVPIVGPRYDDGLLGLTMSRPKADQTLRVLRIAGYEWALNTNTQGNFIGRYPALSLTEAWKEVSQNSGSFAKLKLRRTGSEFEQYQPLSVTKVSIERVFLAYYDSWEFQKVMQPIYAFQGTFQTTDGNFGDVVIYYPAINPSLIEKAPTKVNPT